MFYLLTFSIGGYLSSLVNVDSYRGNRVWGQIVQQTWEGQVLKSPNLRVGVVNWNTNHKSKIACKLE